MAILIFIMLASVVFSLKTFIEVKTISLKIRKSKVINSAPNKYGKSYEFIKGLY
jgi:hypothetical protein